MARLSFNEVNETVTRERNHVVGNHKTKGKRVKSKRQFRDE